MRQTISTLVALGFALAAAVGAQTNRVPGIPIDRSQITTSAFDPADTAFRRAREALNSGDPRRAADMFADLVAKYPASPLAPDALYWRAYSLNRYASGREQQTASRSLSSALEALETRINNYPNRTPIPDAEPLRQQLLQSRGMRYSVEGRLVSLSRGAPGGTRGGSTPDRVSIGRDAVLGSRGRTLYVLATPGPSCVSLQDDPRLDAIAVLVSLDAQTALTGLRQLLPVAGPCDEPIRAVAAGHLSLLRLPPAIVVPILVPLATSDPSAIVRTAAFESLGRVRGNDALRSLDSVVTFGTDPYTRGQALNALANRDDASVDSILARVAADERVPAGLRQQATQARASSVMTNSAMSTLRSLRSRARTERERESIDAALASPTARAMAQSLVPMVVKPAPEPNDRSRYLTAIIQLQPPTADVIALYDQLGGQPRFQQPIIDELVVRSDRASVDKIIQIARTGGGSVVGGHALTALGKLNDPRVPGVLLELIRNPGDVRK